MLTDGTSFQQPSHEVPGRDSDPGLGDFGSILRLDPLDDDDLRDRSLCLTERELLRLILVAAETGSRFQRENVAVDPVAWLLSPRQLFEGRSAFEACRELRPFKRAILLHGLSLGLDASAEAIDALTLKDDETPLPCFPVDEIRASDILESEAVKATGLKQRSPQRACS